MKKYKKIAVTVLAAILASVATGCGGFNLEKQLELAQTSVANKEYEAALQTYDTIIEHEPTNTEARQGVIDIYVETNDQEAAIAAYDTASADGVIGLSLQVELPDSINVYGNLRTLDIEQAKAYAQAVRDDDAEYVRFFEVDGKLAMLSSELTYYMYYAYSYKSRLNTTLYTWDGSEMQTNENVNSLVLHDGEFIARIEKGGYGVQDASTMVMRYYGFSNGLVKELPEYFYLQFWYASSIEEYIENYEKNYNNMLTEMGCKDALIEHTTSLGYESGSSYWKDGEWHWFKHDNSNIVTELFGNDADFSVYEDEEYNNNAADFLRLIEGSDSYYRTYDYPHFKHIIEENQKTADKQNESRDATNQKTVQYLLRDLNNDGNPELMLFNVEQGWYHCLVYETTTPILTIQFGVASSGGSRTGLSFPEDGNGLYLVTASSFSPDISYNLYLMGTTPMQKGATQKDVEGVVPLDYEILIDGKDLSALGNWQGN